MAQSDNKKELEDTIVSAAGRLNQSHINSRELGIQFVQIGKDAGAEEYLKHLDNDLRGQYKIDVSALRTINATRYPDLMMKHRISLIPRHSIRRSLGSRRTDF